ncbi:hypothetical protein TNCV_496151 [Trichonephila clavipes]|nr:hypothetical protein TNCV_496151 [Trichonephila clavipes]
MSIDVTVQVSPEFQLRMKTNIWQKLPKEADRAHHSTYLVSFSHGYDIFKANRVLRYNLQSDLRHMENIRYPLPPSNIIERHRYVDAEFGVFFLGNYTGLENRSACSNRKHDRPNLSARHSETLCAFA